MDTGERRLDPAKLKRCRERAGFPTQTKAAAALGVSKSRYNNWESGLSQPRVGQLGKIMREFRVTFLGDLLTGEGA